MSCVTCHVTCHVLHVTCPVSHVTIFFFFFSFFLFFPDKVVKLIGGGSVINEAYPVYFELKHNSIKKLKYSWCFPLRPTMLSSYCFGIAPLKKSNFQGLLCIKDAGLISGKVRENFCGLALRNFWTQGERGSEEKWNIIKRGWVRGPLTKRGPGRVLMESMHTIGSLFISLYSIWVPWKLDVKYKTIFGSQPCQRHVYILQDTLLRTYIYIVSLEIISEKQWFLQFFCCWYV